MGEKVRGMAKHVKQSYLEATERPRLALPLRIAR
jgi:hypothetical protein